MALVLGRVPTASFGLPRRPIKLHLPNFSSSSTSPQSHHYPLTFQKTTTSAAPPFHLLRINKHICRAGEYVFPDPIPEFADAETEKFRNHLVKKLLKKDIFGDSLNEVVDICTEILNSFLHTEYGGPGTLLVIPFIDMADTINERGLPGGPQAARAAVVWAQKHVDKDWTSWTADERRDG